ncbi:MAG: GNAT family N-acetyltransferase [Rubrivivax sp.]|jgi:GNAT superfamily N-acetyltransferase|nr:GNAT family N-acetyltransferase [Rubrivivax sp.]
MPSTPVDADSVTIRALQPVDLDAVVAIDAVIEGHSRRDYIERRLHAAKAHPPLHAQFAAEHDGALIGFLLARLAHGEFGRQSPSLRIELVGLQPGHARRGVGRRLFEALRSWAARHGATEIRTLSSWKRSGMLAWLAGLGFELAPNLVVESRVGDSRLYADREGPLAVDAGEGPGQEVDFGRDEANDQERHARHGVDVRVMTAADLDAIVRIDRVNTGSDRRDYLSARLAEAEQNRAVRASLAAHCDGTVVGYLMARADLGDFGRTEPVAVIDTLGVDPGYAHRGVGHALMAQLFANLGALRVEAVESSVPLTDGALLGFMVACGFRNSPRLAFRRAV